MFRRPTILAGLAAAAALAAPASAVAAEGFVGVLENGQVVRFQSDKPTGLSTFVRIRGMAPRETIVALGSLGPRVYAIGSSARLYAVNVRGARAFPIGGPFAQGLRGRRFTLAINADGSDARVTSDVGQHLKVDIATGATTALPSLKLESGVGAFPTVDFTADGRLEGIDLQNRNLLTETAPGSGVLSRRPFEVLRGEDLTEPVTYKLTDAGRPFMLAAFGGTRFRPQSIVRPIEATPTSAGTSPVFRPHLRRVISFAPIGEVPDDTAPPSGRLEVPSRGLSIRALLEGRLPIEVTVAEGANVVAWVRVAGRLSGPGVSTRDTPARHRIRNFRLTGVSRRRVRSLVGRTVVLRVVITDWADNRSVLQQRVRLRR